MIHYEKNVATVLNVLAKHRYDERSLRLSQRCYEEFRHYMGNGDHTTFSQEAALKWCNSKVGKTYKNQFANAIQRLVDVYAYGKVLKEHIKFFGALSEAWSHDLNKYLQTLLLESNYSSNYQQEIKIICTQFCRLAQMSEISSVKEVSYPFLEKYHQYIKSRYKSYSYVEGIVSKFLGYLSDHNKCRKAYSLFAHYIGMGKCTFFNNLSENSRKAIEYQREANRYFSSDQFYSSLPDYKGRLESAGYSKRIQQSYSYYLTLLYLFLDRADLRYDKVIADVWLRDLGDYLFGNESRKARRAIEMYEDYHRTEDVISERWWKHSITAYDILPEWCKVEIQHFYRVRRHLRFFRYNTWNNKEIHYSRPA